MNLKLYMVVFLCSAAVIPAVWGNENFLADESAPMDTLQLAVFTPVTKVYENPGGEWIGVIDRGRVINLLASDGKWLCFTTRDYPKGWIRWENTITLEEWAVSPPFDSIAAIIRIWEIGVQAMEKEIDSALTNILSIREKIADGVVDPNAGIDLIQKERAAIEESFRQLHGLNTPEPLNEAEELLEGKRWAINQGLGYLITFIGNGDEKSGAAAGRYFELAENMMYQYSRAIFQVKSLYKLYNNGVLENNP